jgi:hypothetical protein
MAKQSFIFKQIEHMQFIEEQTGKTPLYLAISEALVNRYDEEALLKMGQGVVSKQNKWQRRVLNSGLEVQSVANTFTNKEAHWLIDSYDVLDSDAYAQVVQMVSAGEG